MKKIKRKKIERGSMISRLNKVFIMQLIFISIATVLGVLGAAKVVEDVLIKEALIGEAEFYWEHKDRFVEFPLPKTMNLTGYVVENNDFSLVPKALKNITEQYQRIELNGKRPIAYVSERGDTKLILVFEEAQVSKLALYFGITPLIIVLLIVYLPAFVSFVFSKRAFSPVLQLVDRLESAKISKSGIEKLKFDDIKQTGHLDVNVLIDSFEDFSVRISQLISRERNFSRYASHELRTPLTVLRGSMGMLKKQKLTDKGMELVTRMEPMIEEMQALIEALLMLSRNEVSEVSEEPVLVNDLLKSTVQDTIRLFDPRDIKLHWHAKHLIQAHMPEQLFCIVVSNLVRNACLHSKDPVLIKVEVDGAKITIEDNGKGMSAEQLSRIFEPFYKADEHEKGKGFGLGLAIVDMICKQCDWEIEFASELGVGTSVTLTLNEIEILASEKLDKI
ncbi:sensor histidine kinase [Marinicella litoralis]|uniref:histidine kinase n=1 Tax=Marinicella litoralis TaxID=644220 RepID=A0A4R6XWQ5_9GAMM|nr:HAMP domain-containing sensor histidine kinase [Marinicella litoralis]TDR22684.1 signal transduction histidine kinase [Marinicella litoralis]